ncbi:MAG: GNAT family N-acetyltransferase [Thermomicrobiales bacterium]|nr:GNAT family N-acetyltransferase [Thermomicrobiales bacterium]
MNEQQPVLNLVGERVALGPLTVEHAPAITRWYNDYGTMRHWGYLPGPRTEEQARQYFQPDGFLGSATTAAFAVYETGAWDLVGMAGVFQIDHVNRTAELFAMIGETRDRGKGYGTEATRLVLDHAFLGLGLSNIVLRVVASNTGGIRAYEKAGFRPIGIRRACKMIGGRLHDSLYMEALAEEFESPLLKQVLLPDEPTAG